MLITNFTPAFLLALCIVFPAYKIGLLTRSGAVTAVLIGTVVHGSTGWFGTLALLTFFISSAALARHRRKTLPSADTVAAKGERRDAIQVLANGGVAALCGVMTLVTKVHPVWDAALLGAIAASMSDTWSTEIGRTYGSQPKDWFTRKPVVLGTSGGITLIGSLGGLAGAICLATVGWVSVPNWQLANPISFATMVGGMSGCAIDTVLGSTFQELRRCALCSTKTEHNYHCGKRTRLYRGFRGFTNDAVNLVCSMVGAITSGTIMLVLTQ